jgi:DNA-binding NarL/FixJ family response regulator
MHLGMPDVRVLVVEPLPALAAALREPRGGGPRIRVVAAVPNARTAVARLRDAHVDAVVVDLAGVQTEGPSVVRRVRAAAPDAKVLVVAPDCVPEAATFLIAAGASGVVDLTHRPEVLREAVLRAVAGELVLPDRDLSVLVEYVRAPAEKPPFAGIGSLTTRERQVLCALADGYSTSEVAVRLAISTMTVQSHVKSVFGKLGVHSKMEAVRLAWREGLATIPASA